MRFGGRLQAAIEVLDDVEARRRPVADTLKDWGLSHRFAGSGDRAAVGNLVYDALRWRASSAWLAGDEASRPLLLAMLMHRWAIAADDLAGRMAGDAHAPETLPEAEAAAIAARDLAEAPDHVRADVPAWIAPMMAEAFGDAWVAEGAASARRPPLDLRVNRLKVHRDRVARALAKSGVVETPHAADGLRVPPTTGEGRHPGLTVDPAFLKGWFDIQDEGSQLAASMVGARPGEKILDLCAGAGGKTLALSATMENRGQIFATDADKGRLAPIYDRARRAGTRNVQIRPAGRPLDDLTEKMDAVLIDAPCTGTGTWRRRPDSKWRLRPEAIAVRAAEQDALLRTGAGLVRPGGRLVYVTCSFLPQENEARVTTFLDRHAGFSAGPAADLAALAGLVGESVYLGENGVQLGPGRTGTDAFFVASLQRSVA